jgi:hypothetical protein
MISIFIFHSPDRINALRATISCLEEMEFYEKCQKTLIVDEKTDYIPLNFDLVRVPRVNNRFNWSRMWEAGVLTSKHSISLYLDSDRLLPRNYLSLVLENIQENSFVFTSRHFMMMREIALEECKDFLQRSQEDLFKDTKYFGKLRFESRYKEPITGPGKNVMSGNTAFYKSTYFKIGGVDPWYEGHGAFADTDFHLKAANCGCKFIDLESTEIHYMHKKLENNNALTEDELHKLSLDNYIYFCKKWSLPMVLAEDIAYKIKIENPKEYVNVRWNEIG